MTAATRPAPAAATAERASWVPMVALALGQVLMSFNVAALPVSLGGMVDDFDVPPTRVSTAIVMYGVAVAALVMAGAKIGQRLGWVRVFRVMVALFLVAEVLMVVSPAVEWVIAAQAWPGRRPRSSCRRSWR